jgi:hypothetical protein
MNTTILMLSLLLVLGLLAIFVVVRRSTQPKPGPAQQDTGRKTETLDPDEDAQEEIARSLIDKYGDVSFFELMTISAESKEAASQAMAAGNSTESARKAALEVFRNTFETMLHASHWRSSWRQDAWEVDKDAYAEISRTLENEHGEIILRSKDAISQLLDASAEAAIQAFRHAKENGLDTGASRTAALDAYQTTFEARLAEEQTKGPESWYAGERLRALPPEQIRRIEERMRPGGKRGMRPSGVFSVSGFLAPGESLIARIEEDERTLHELGITPEQVADRLESLVGQASRMLNLAKRGELELDRKRMHKLSQPNPELLVAGHFLLTVTCYMGYQECPFEDEEGRLCRSALFGETDFCLRNTHSGAVLDFPGLIIHLIRAHHFFEGTIPYRVDPRTAVTVLELQPGVDYRPRYRRESVWHLNEGTGNTSDQAVNDFPRLKAIKQAPDVVLELADGVHLYCRGDHCLTIAKHEYPVAHGFTFQGALWGRRTVLAGTWSLVRSTETFVELTE